MRRHIRASFASLPVNPNSEVNSEKDMAFRDKARRRAKAERVGRRREMESRARESRAREIDENGEDWEDELEKGSLNETQLKAMSVIVAKNSSPARLKKPFSDDSLFNALLESQVVGDVAGDRWDLSETLKDE